ncbi:MAG: NYN domain-containing protein [Veillonellaceae bacterium]|nr:NYN domain-containing protein [Veillonellaceae bacterium]
MSKQVELRTLWLVDGYNVIFADEEYWHLREEDLEHSRQRLTDALLDIAAHRDLEVYLVFDGQRGGRLAEEYMPAPHFHVVYTARRETADAYIERQTFLLRGSYRDVFVITSDGPEQSQISGNGAYRKSVRELLEEMAADKREQETVRARSGGRVSVAEQLAADSHAELERLRHRK